MVRPVPNNLSDFAMLMRRRREELGGMSQAEAAAKIGVKEGTYRSWELDERTPGPEARAKIIAALEINPAKIATVDSVLACVHGWLASGATRSDCAALIAWLGEHKPGTGLGRVANGENGEAKTTATNGRKKTS